MKSLENLRFKRALPNSVYNFHNAKDIKLIIRLGLGLKHLRYP